MDNSIYILLSKEIGLYDHMEQIADNLANAESVGVHSKDVIFTEKLVKEGVKKQISFANDLATALDMRNGSIKMTNEPLDLAIQGIGFFRILVDQEECYTRAGNFLLNQDGQLVTHSGKIVLNNGGGAIEFEPNARDIKIDQEGFITVNGADFDQLGITIFKNPKSLIPIAESLYRKGEALEEEPEVLSYKIIQGGLEMSNINKIKQLTASIEVKQDSTAISNMITDNNKIEDSLIKTLIKSR